MWVTKETTGDHVAGDKRFWEWVSAFVQKERVQQDKGIVRLRLAVSLHNQDAALLWCSRTTTSPLRIRIGD